MIKKFFLVSYFLSLSLWGNTAITENEPNSLVEGIVSAITGDLYLHEEDIVIQGAEPLVLSRSYISAKGEGEWTNIGFYIHQLNPKKDVHVSSHLEAVRHVQSDTLEIPEPNGSVLTYRFDHSVPKKHHQTEHHYVLASNEFANGLTNTARGALTAQTNVKNQYVVRSDQGHILTVYYPDGRLRRYRNVHHQKKIELPSEKPDECEHDTKKGYKEYRYILMFERLPNGNSLCYSWDSDNRLDMIRTADGEGKKTFAWAKFSYLTPCAINKSQDVRTGEVDDPSLS